MRAVFFNTIFSLFSIQALPEAQNGTKSHKKQAENISLIACIYIQDYLKKARMGMT